ncbi:hypothetical protein M8J75_016561 [Diaphorina citri]|nr:hypothetical protein M8J75_016561 [Diaphorina citri]
MPSFRQKFVGFIRQLSNTSDSARDSDVPDNASECFIQNYLKGSEKVNKNEPVILHGKKPYEIPPMNIGAYDTNEIKAADTGPDGGLVTVNKKDDGNANQIIAGVDNWENSHERAYGKSCSLYEVHPVTSLRAGDPIADCYGVLVREDSAILALADGVNWGVKASVAAKAAVHGCIDYMNEHLFASASPKPCTTTEVFTSLLRSFHTAHTLILKEKGMLTTLTAAVVLPLDNVPGKYIVCTCSHDVHQMRDMRDALGALGPVDGQNPELSNLTLSMTEVERGDIVFLTSDGVSDNLDPVVGKFTGLPTVEAHQRHKLSLLRTEDLFRYGVSGKGPSISSARELVTLLLDFVTRLTAAKRHILEDKDLYAGRDGRTLSSSEQITRRREVCKKLHAIPGKLDHATVAAYMVGKFGDTSRSEEHKGRDNRDIRGDVDTSRVDVDTVRDKIETLKVQDTSRGDEVRDNSSIGDVEQDAVETLKVRQVHDGDDVKRRDSDNISSDVKKERKENDNRRVKTKESKGDKEVHRSGVEDKAEKRTNEENI